MSEVYVHLSSKKYLLTHDGALLSDHAVCIN